MDKQLLISWCREDKVLDEKHFPPVFNSELPIKPCGGLETSTFLSGGNGSEQVMWRAAEDFYVPKKGYYSYLLIPRKNARIYTIDTLADLAELLKRFPRTDHIAWIMAPTGSFYPNFEQVSWFYDAIHLTSEGQWRTRLTRPNLYGWDYETTVWLNWCFEQVIPIGRHRFKMI